MWAHLRSDAAPTNLANLHARDCALYERQGSRYEEKDNRQNRPSSPSVCSSAKHSTSAREEQDDIADYHSLDTAKLDIQNVVQQQLDEQKENRQADLDVIQHRSRQLSRRQEQIAQ